MLRNDLSLIDAHDHTSGKGALGPIVRAAPAQILAANAATITFSNISQAFQHLQLRLLSRSNAAAAVDYVYVQFNGDATKANYWYVQTRSVGGGTPTILTTSASDLGVLVAEVPAGSSEANAAAVCTVDIFDYARTLWKKRVQSINSAREGSAATAWVQNQIGGGWLSTSAVTSLTLVLLTGSFRGDTVAELYGVP